jgi:hypothetical protein
MDPFRVISSLRRIISGQSIHYMRKWHLENFVCYFVSFKQPSQTRIDLYVYIYFFLTAWCAGTIMMGL